MWVQELSRNGPKSCHLPCPTHHPAVAVTGHVSWLWLCHGTCPSFVTTSPGGGMESCHSPALRWERAGGERGAQGMGAGDGRDVGCGGVAAGGPKGRGGAGGTAWACPFKRRCLLSSFGTQPLSCLRLQRRRIKGLFHLNETLSPTSRGAASPTASSSARGARILPLPLPRGTRGCPSARGLRVGDSG